MIPTVADRATKWVHFMGFDQRIRTFVLCDGVKGFYDMD